MPVTKKKVAKKKTTTMKKAVAKSASLEAKVAAALQHLEEVTAHGTVAVNLRSTASKKLSTLISRLSKKRAALIKRKKVIATKLKAAPSADLRKLLRDIEKDFKNVVRDLTKARAEKSGHTAELAGLKEHLRKATAYLKHIGHADKVLNKPKKKRKTNRTKKVAA